MKHQNSHPNHFQELNLTEIKLHAVTWAKRYQEIEDISLYRAHTDESFKYSLIITVLDPKYPFLNWATSDCLHIRDDLPSFYKEQPPQDVLDYWMWYHIEHGDEIPSEFMIEDTKLSLYARKGVESKPESLTSAKKRTSASEEHENAFIFKGDFWSVYYEGNDSNIKDMERIRYIVYLIDRPNRTFYANELKSLVKGKPLESISEEQSPKDGEQLVREGSTLDDMAIESLSDKDKEALEETMYKSWEKLSTAKKNGAEVKIKKAEQEFNAARNFMYNEYGLQVHSSPKGLLFKMYAKLTNEAERTRVSVQKQITSAIKDIRGKIPTLADHLNRYIETGAQCVYRPDPDHPKWRVEWNS